MKSVQTEMFVYSFDATTFRLVPYFQEQGLLGLKLRPLAAFPMMLKTQQTLCRLLEYNPCRVHIYIYIFSVLLGEPFTCAGGRRTKDTGHFEEIHGIGVNEH